MRQSTFYKKVASSNENVVTATSTPSASNQTIEISNITQLATAARWTSESAIQTLGTFDPNAKLKDVTFIVGGVTPINLTSPLTIKLAVTDPNGSTKNVEISIDPDNDTFQSVINKMNQHADLGVNAFYDDVTKKVVINKNKQERVHRFRLLRGKSCFKRLVLRQL